MNHQLGESLSSAFSKFAAAKDFQAVYIPYCLVQSLKRWLLGILDAIWTQENYGLLCDLATGVRILVLRYPLVAHLMTTERPSRTASLLDPGRIPRKLQYSSREQAFKFLISPSNIAAVGRFPHTWSDSCRILLISSSLLWRIEAD
jgi:hypothetical protein